MPSLLRPIWRNIAPSPPSATGVTQRSFAALQLLDPDHLGAEVTQQGAAKRPGDVSAEIEDAYSFQHARHRTLALAQSKNMLGFRKTASTRQPSSVHASWRLPALRQT
jgi:hypothetical protein